MPDIVKKKKEIKNDIADQGLGVIDSRTEVLENVQLGEEMKAALCWAVTSNNLPYCASCFYVFDKVKMNISYFDNPNHSVTVE